MLLREQTIAYCKYLEKIEHKQAWIIGIVESSDLKAHVIKNRK